MNKIIIIISIYKEIIYIIIGIKIRLTYRFFYIPIFIIINNRNII